MVKVLAPLGSTQAWGTVAGVLTFQRTPDGSSVHFKYPKTRESTLAQKVAQFDYSCCVSDWRIVPEADWEKWSMYATRLQLTGMNLFMQWWFQELFSARYGVGFYAGTRYKAERTDPKINPYYMEHYRKEIYGK